MDLGKDRLLFFAIWNNLILLEYLWLRRRRRLNRRRWWVRPVNRVRDTQSSYSNVVREPILADHILACKTSSNYSTNALPKSQMAAAVRPNFEAGRASPMFARPSSSPSPPIIRSTPARPSPSPPVFRSILSPQTSGSSSMSSSDNDVEADASDNSQSAAGQSLAATAEEISPDVAFVSIKSIKAAKLKRKRTVPLPDNFALKKKKKEDDALAQAIMSQINVLSSMMTDKNQNISVATSNNVANSSDISPVINAFSFALQSVPRERHFECMVEVFKIISEKYAKQ